MDEKLGEPRRLISPTLAAEAKEAGMEHKVVDPHTHQHGPDCGHTAIEHDGHTDYLHEGHLHHPHEGHVDDHRLAVSTRNPSACTPNHDCGAHRADHQHGTGCGHESIPHGDHVDYIVEGHLHHPHGDHCDDHGPVDRIEQR